MRKYTVKLADGEFVTVEAEGFSSPEAGNRAYVFKRNGRPVATFPAFSIQYIKENE